jgi:hypothetical protein
MVPQNPIAAAAQGDLLALIFFVVVFGAAATAIDADKRRPLVAFFTAVNDVSMVVIGWLMRVAPVAVSGPRRGHRPAVRNGPALEPERVLAGRHRRARAARRSSC